MQKKHIRKKNQRFLLFLPLWTKKKTPNKVSLVSSQGLEPWTH